MATSQITPAPQTAANARPPALLVSLPSLDRESLDHMLANLGEAFAGQPILVATPDAPPAATPADANLQVTSYTPAALSASSFTLTAADFFNAHELARSHGSQAVLQLGTGANTLAPHALRALAGPVLDASADLAAACYDLPARSGLVNSAILFPLTRALFNAHVRFPLGLDLCLSARALERLAVTSQRFTAARQPDALQWPAIEIIVAGMSVTEVEVGTRTLPPPPTDDFNSLLSLIAGSLFAEVDLRAAYWQRARVPAPIPPSRRDTRPAPENETAQLQGMIDGFRNAYGNLHEIWSLVLPPQSLVGLKRLSVAPAETFAMSDSLWARIVYDFLLAFRLRTLNRGHLLGALTPLYFAWVASHLLLTAKGTDPERHIQMVAAAFEADKPYLVSRWRWPDRFNP